MVSSISDQKATGPDAVPSLSSLTLVPLLFLAASLFFRRWTAEAVDVRDALKRYDAQPARCHAQQDGTEAIDEQEQAQQTHEEGQGKGASKESVPHAFAIPFITVPILLVYFACLFVIGFSTGKRQALYEYGWAVGMGMLAPTAPWMFQFGMPGSPIAYVSRVDVAKPKHGDAQAAATEGRCVAAGKPQVRRDTFDSSPFLFPILLLKMFVAGIVTAKTGLLVPILYFSSISINANPHGRSLWKGFLVLVLGSGAFIIASFLVSFALVWKFPDEPSSGVKPEDSCDPQAGDCTLKNVTFEQYLTAFLTTPLALSYALAPVLTALIAARNFDLLAADKESGDDLDLQPERFLKGPFGMETVITASKAATSSLGKRDTHGKIPERFNPQHRTTAYVDQATKLPTYTAAVRALQGFLAAGVLILLGVAIVSLDDASEVKRGIFPTFFHPITLQGLLFDPNVKHRQLALAVLIVLAVCWGLASYVVVLLAASLSVYQRSGLSGVRQLWTVTDRIWHEGPVVFSEEERVPLRKG
ncbi:unnamed protein product [Tilletia controversa]|uniref:Uncharacterized protein n=3 Tax=Tilletia TaxID=13289 RepID=A0A8X7MP17_9BASI|nr:hypothetical protein CF336_g6666 [Tilletia laevis]KAE8189580.1 hypothetical protein CF328_g6230 [Tilletia controversa]KAE8253095.1 hypothetical protein A4X03_0g5986 [Tilletia caries]KAE8192143.1 hypothetical protein CF335_g5911 [Tilletia laevis]KAE8242750.1 hypothetical protein A4X06_0g6772 [Tilletia controversa]